MAGGAPALRLLYHRRVAATSLVAENHRDTESTEKKQKLSVSVPLWFYYCSQAKNRLDKQGRIG
jgi:hypothetical protein